mmetsp:Transcript_35992/g.101356  ORF Transcript_35992/g.101356 Transcript_35992/m.101356 type:complete len:167 (+) Transcript_35992:112-612(+)
MGNGISDCTDAITIIDILDQPDGAAKPRGAAAARPTKGSAPPTCSRPGCGKPTWNGERGDYCSVACKRGAVCPAPGCGRPSWNGRPNEHCSTRCRDLEATCPRPGCGKPSWTWQPGGYCSRRCQAEDQDDHAASSPASEAKHGKPKQLQHQFTKAWAFQDQRVQSP